MKISNNTPLKLSAKKLKSGKCQVRFSFTASENDGWYGYMLADPGETLKDVVGKIRYGLGKMVSNDPFYGLQSHLYHLEANQEQQRRLFLFRQKALSQN
jgi:hypothetical protein